MNDSCIIYEIYNLEYLIINSICEDTGLYIDAIEIKKDELEDRMYCCGKSKLPPFGVLVACVDDYGNKDGRHLMVLDKRDDEYVRKAIEQTIIKIVENIKIRADILIHRLPEVPIE